jgi:hypothetical protein
MEIVKVPLSTCVPWEKNPRSISRQDYSRLLSQIKRLGLYKPLIAYPDGDRFVVLGGNMRLRALRDLNHEEAVLSIVHPKTEAEKLEFNLSDNDRAGEYDEQALAELTYQHRDAIILTDYKIDLGPPLTLKSLLSRFAPDGDDPDDSTPALDDTPAVTLPGDIFSLGPHLLVCGDADAARRVYDLLKDRLPDMIFFGAQFFPFLPVSRGWIVWDKNNTGSFGQAELAWSSFDRPVRLYKHTWNGLQREGPRAEELRRRAHPTQKPVGLLARIITDFTREKAVILDPFVGSGSTLIAAEKTGRTCYAVEIDPKYCDLTLLRYAAYKGVPEASLRGTRRSFLKPGEGEEKKEGVGRTA